MQAQTTTDDPKIHSEKRNPIGLNQLGAAVKIWFPRWQGDKIRDGAICFNFSFIFAYTSQVMFNFSLNNIFIHFSKDIVKLCAHIKEYTQTQTQ